jgi:hypothetical protein
MIKAKFGDDRLSKTFTAQVNEALAKVGRTTSREGPDLLRAR